MADREKVMQWLEACANGCEDGCPYEYKNLVHRVECKADLMSDALELLKEQEPVKPVSYLPYGWLCGRCLQPLEGIYDYRPKYCPNCGREVLWND